jgi:hypothetical protein
MIGLLGCLALVLDAGGWFANDRVLKRGADAAALAGARQLAWTGDQTAAASAASANVSDNNGLPAPNENTFATATGYPQTTANSVTVRVFKSASQLPQAMVPPPAQNARHATSTAVVQALTGAPGVVPLLAYQSDAQAGGTRTINIRTTPGNANAIPWTGSGYFGWANPCGQGVGNAAKCIPEPICITAPTSSCDFVTVNTDFHRIIGRPNLVKVLDKLCPSGSCAPGTPYNGLDLVIPIYTNNPCPAGSVSCSTGDISYEAAPQLAVVKLLDGHWEEKGPNNARYVEGWLQVTFERFVPPGAVGGSIACSASFGACAIALVN